MKTFKVGVQDYLKEINKGHTICKVIQDDEIKNSTTFHLIINHDEYMDTDGCTGLPSKLFWKENERLFLKHFNCRPVYNNTTTTFWMPHGSIYHIKKKLILPKSWSRH